MRAWVYILASRRNGTLYVGFTNCLVRRLEQHRGGAVPGFSSRYHVHRLVYCEEHQRVIDARTRERQIKKWRRAWKVALIEASNPYWRDLVTEVSPEG